MRMTPKMVAVIAAGVVAGLAVALHLFGGDFGRMIHGSPIFGRLVGR